jgi:hypothetical protein
VRIDRRVVEELQAPVPTVRVDREVVRRSLNERVRGVRG